MQETKTIESALPQNPRQYKPNPKQWAADNLSFSDLWCLPEYSEIICGLPRLFVIISSSSPPPPRAAGGEDELQDGAVGQAG